MTFGRELTGIQHRLDAVTAHVSDGAAEDFDLLIGADGMRSTVRRLVLEETTSPLYMNGGSTRMPTKQAVE